MDIWPKALSMAYGAVAAWPTVPRGHLSSCSRREIPLGVSHLGPLPKVFQPPRHTALLCCDLRRECSHSVAPKLGKLSNTLARVSAELPQHSRMDPSKHCPVLQPVSSTSCHGFNQRGKAMDTFPNDKETRVQKCFTLHLVKEVIL